MFLSILPHPALKQGERAKEEPLGVTYMVNKAARSHAVELGELGGAREGCFSLYIWGRWDLGGPWAHIREP